jgi:hypothetical protein
MHTELSSESEKDISAFAELSCLCPSFCILSSVVAPPSPPFKALLKHHLFPEAPVPQVRISVSPSARCGPAAEGCAVHNSVNDQILPYLY